MKRPLPPGAAVKAARKERGMTQQQLAEDAGLSIQHIRAIEGGYHTLRDETKKKIAAALDWSVWALFPDVKVEVDLYAILVARHGEALKISESQVAMFKEVLSRMGADEFEELIESGTTPADVHKAIRAWAKAHDIEVVMK